MLETIFQCLQAKLSSICININNAFVKANILYEAFMKALNVQNTEQAWGNNEYLKLMTSEWFGRGRLFRFVKQLLTSPTFVLVG